MAAPGKPGASRWGSFLSQAVAGVESRLDNMLAEGEEQQQQQQPQTQAPMSAAVKPSSSESFLPASLSNVPDQKLQLRHGRPQILEPMQTIDYSRDWLRPWLLRRHKVEEQTLGLSRHLAVLSIPLEAPWIDRLRIH